MASTEVTVSVKDTEAFISLLEASAEFFEWYNKTYLDNHINDPEHPWCKLRQVLDGFLDRSIASKRIMNSKNDVGGNSWNESDAGYTSVERQREVSASLAAKDNSTLNNEACDSERRSR